MTYQTPQDLEAEQAVLGTCLMEPDMTAHVVKMLKEEDFYREHHKKIYKVTLKLFNRGEPVDIVTVAEELRRMGQLEVCGNTEYLVALCEQTNNAQPLDKYFLTLRECAKLRHLLTL